jgi:hypothetical protein
MRKLTDNSKDGHLSDENGLKTDDVLTHQEVSTSLVPAT